MKKTSIADFKPAMHARTIKETGVFSLTHEGLRPSINTSSIWSELIGQAGRWCERFSSDLLIYLIPIYNKIADGSIEPGEYLFGFCENGVDDAHSILDNYAGTEYARYIYRDIHKLTIDIVDNKITMTLVEVDR